MRCFVRMSRSARSFRRQGQRAVAQPHNQLGCKGQARASLKSSTQWVYKQQYATKGNLMRSMFNPTPALLERCCYFSFSFRLLRAALREDVSMPAPPSLAEPPLCPMARMSPTTPRICMNLSIGDEPSDESSTPPCPVAKGSLAALRRSSFRFSLAANSSNRELEPSEPAPSKIPPVPYPKPALAAPA